MPRTTAVLNALAAYRTWRLAQEAYAKAVEGGNPREITARYTELQTPTRNTLKPT
jgi:hypothetical protein